MTRSDDIKLLIAVFKQWQSARIDTNEIGKYLGISSGAAGMRLFRLKARLNTGEGPTNADIALLIAITNQERRLPRLDNRLISADLEINPGAAAMRWWRYKMRLEEHIKIVKEQEKATHISPNDLAETPTALAKEKSNMESGVFGWPYNAKGWPDEAWEA